MRGVRKVVGRVGRQVGGAGGYEKWIRRRTQAQGWGSAWGQRLKALGKASRRGQVGE